MDPVTISALIGAAASAATTAVSATMSTVNAQKSKNPIACVFINNTPYEWETVDGYGQPYHGQMLVSPTSKVVSLIEGAEKSGESDWTESNYATWGLMSTGVGTDCVIVYCCQEIDLYVAFYAGNHATPPFAAVSLSKKDWFKDQEPKKGDPKGEWIRNHIKHRKHYHKAHKNVSESCDFSRGAAKVVLGQIEVSFHAGIQETRFEMQFNGDWTPFITESLLVGSGSQDS